MIVYIYNIGVDLYNGFNGLRHRINWTYFSVLDGLAHPLYSIDKLIAFAKKYQNTSAIDSQEVLDQLNKLSGSLKNQLSGLFNKAQSEGWLDKIINFIKSLFN
mgnify:CR=1 FL=1